MKVNVDDKYFSNKRITVISLSKDEALTLIGSLAEAMRPIPAMRSGASYYPHVTDDNGVDCGAFVIKVDNDG